MKPEIKIIKDFLAVMGLEKLIKVHADKKTSVFVFTKTINFSKTAYQKSLKSVSDMTMKILAEKGLDFSGISYGTFSILHEIGHIIMIATHDDADGDYDDYIRQLNKLNREYDKNYLKFGADEAQRINQIAYRKLQIEDEADRKAYEIYISFPKECKALDQLMIKECGD